MRPSRIRFALSALFIPAFAAFAVVSSLCPRASTWAAETTSTSVREALRNRLEQAGMPPVLTVGGERVHAAETTARFFRDRAFEPAWTSGAEVGRAVQRFQARHGLDVDGVVGKETVPELDRAVEERIQQIVVNLERWRWLPQSLGRRYVLVNIHGFDLRGVEDGLSVLEMRAIVGKTYRRTPVFSDEISHLVLNPTWTIPPSIAVQDKLPLIREDPSYLARQNIKVLSGWGADAREVDPDSIDWATVNAKDFRYRLRQEPGVLNALGTMKFMFPNKFNVYLHDTPARELFAQGSRDFSSGCIRIERPFDLALFLLNEDQGWSLEKLEAKLADQREQTVKLPHAVPVHIQYWTAWVEDDGSVSFRKDLYGRDDRVADALREPPPAKER